VIKPVNKQLNPSAPIHHHAQGRGNEQLRPRSVPTLLVPYRSSARTTAVRPIQRSAIPARQRQRSLPNRGFLSSLGSLGSPLAKVRFFLQHTHEPRTTNPDMTEQARDFTIYTPTPSNTNPNPNPTAQPLNRSMYAPIRHATPLTIAPFLPAVPCWPRVGPVLAV